MANPPQDVINCMTAVMVLFGHYCGSWVDVTKILGRSDFLNALCSYDLNSLTLEQYHDLEGFMNDCSMNPDYIARKSCAAKQFAVLVRCACHAFQLNCDGRIPQRPLRPKSPAKSPRKKPASAGPRKNTASPLKNTQYYNTELSKLGKPAVPTHIVKKTSSKRTASPAKQVVYNYERRVVAEPSPVRASIPTRVSKPVQVS